MSSATRPHLLVLNQYYHPGVEATAGLLTDICENLAEYYDVTVITGRLRGREADADYERRNGVEIIRVHSASFDRAQLHHRAINYFTYVARALRRGLLGRRPDLVLSMTDPPIVGSVAYAVAKRYRVPFVAVSQDVFPEIAVALGRLGNPLLIVPLRILTRHSFEHADRVVAIGETMKRRLVSKGVAASRIAVIPNWADTTEIAPRDRDNEWARTHGLADRFVVMHSGNIGHAQDLDTLIRAAALLLDRSDITIVLVGFGARHDEYVKLAQSCGASNVTFLPYQSRETLPLSLASSDVHFVGLGRGFFPVRRAEPPGRRHGGGPTGNCRRGGGQRDGSGCARRRLRARDYPATLPRSLRRSASFHRSQPGRAGSERQVIRCRHPRTPGQPRALSRVDRRHSGRVD